MKWGKGEVAVTTRQERRHKLRIWLYFYIPLIIKWLISQKVRPVNASSKTTKETDIEKKRRNKLRGGGVCVCVCGGEDGRGKNLKSEQPKWKCRKLGEDIMCTD